MAQGAGVTANDPRATIEELRKFVDGTPALSVAVVASVPDDDGRPGEPATLTLRGDAEGFFRNEVVGKASETLAEAERLVALDPVYKPDKGTIEYTSANEVAEVALACDAYANLAPMPEFQGDDAFVRRLAYYVVVLGAPGGKQAFVFRSFSQSKELQRKKGAAIVRRDGQYTKVEDRIFLFDESVDCVVFEGVVFVLRKDDFRRIFEQFAVLRDRAMAAAQELGTLVPIANLDEFAKACAGQARMADKLLAAQSRPYFKELTVQKLKPVIAEFGLDLDVEDDDGTEKLVFRPDPAHRWLIVKLLDDDYLRSTLTDNKYEANSKLQHS